LGGGVGDKAGAASKDVLPHISKQALTEGNPAKGHSAKENLSVPKQNSFTGQHFAGLCRMPC
jgi:hypothetical protein